MDFNTNFELRRLLRLLTERLAPACKAQTLEMVELEELKKEIHWEGDKVYVEVMKVMCRAYAEEHLRRYLEVHRHGAEHLKMRAEEMLLKAGEGCKSLLESFRGMLDGVLNWLINWQKRYFEIAHREAEGNGTEIADDLMRPKEVMVLLDISEKTLYNYTVAGEFEYRQIKGTKFYVRASVLNYKKNKER